MKFVRIHLWLMVITIATCTLIYSCKDDNNGSDVIDSNGMISAGDYSFKVNNAFLEDYGITQNNTYNFDLTLTTKDLYFDEAAAELKGHGSFLYFEAFTSNQNELEPGTYTINGDTAEQPGSVSFGDVYYNYIPAADSIEHLISLNAGTFSIDKQDSEYTININGIGEDGTKVTGTYKGALAFY